MQYRYCTHVQHTRAHVRTRVYTYTCAPLPVVLWNGSRTEAHPQGIQTDYVVLVQYLGSGTSILGNEHRTAEPLAFAPAHRSTSRFEYDHHVNVQEVTGRSMDCQRTGNGNKVEIWTGKR